jgi:Holliday junction resolvase RusA-like endonuclease
MMTLKFTIPGRLPGLNDYINAERSNRYIAAKMKKQAEQIILWSLGKKIKFSNPVFIHYLWVEKDRRRDKDNICFAKKFIQDALVKAKVLKNDGWNEIADFKDGFDVDKDNPRIEVTITEVQK